MGTNFTMVLMKVIRDGHEQGRLEAKLEAWAYGGHSLVQNHAGHSVKHANSSSKGCTEANAGQGPPRRVVLNLYNMTTNTLSAGSAPAFHCGVEMDDCEWSFACEGTGSGVVAGTGVFHSIPCKCNAKRYDKSVLVGTTTVRKAEVMCIVQALKKEWWSSSFDPVSFNSLHFCQELCNRLGAGPIPDWVKTSVNCTVEPKQAAFLHSLSCLAQMMSSILCCESHVDTQNTELGLRQINQWCDKTPTVCAAPLQSL